MDEGESGTAKGQLHRTKEKIDLTSEDVNTGSPEKENDQDHNNNDEHQSQQSVIENRELIPTESQEYLDDYENERLETEGNMESSEKCQGKKIHFENFFNR